VSLTLILGETVKEIMEETGEEVLEEMGKEIHKSGQETRSFLSQMCKGVCATEGVISIFSLF
jgi:hypothetical protein